MPQGGPRLRATDERKNQVGVRVQERRVALGITRDALTGRLAYVTDGRWSPALQEVLRIENGRRLVSDVEVIALAQALGCGACWLLLGDAAETEKRTG